VGSAGVLIVDDAHYPPITFSTGHPDGIRQAITSVVRNQYAMNTRDNPSKPLQNTRPNSPHVRCSTAFASSTTLTSSITSTLKISSASEKDNPWDVPFVHVLPLFNRDPLRISIGGLTRLVKKYLNVVLSRDPSEAITQLETDVGELPIAGMVTLNSRLSFGSQNSNGSQNGVHGVNHDKSFQRVGFFWDYVLP